MSELIVMPIQPIAQLIGYSVDGFEELPYVDDETYNTALLMEKEGMGESGVRLKALRWQINELHKWIR